MKQTARAGIEHLHKIKYLDFLKLCEYIVSNYKGVIGKANASVTEKVDGMSLRFGLDKTGKVFVESSYSGPISDLGQYTEYVKSRGYDPSPVSEAFENLLKHFKSNSKLTSLLKKYNENGVKIISEVFYNPLGTKDAQGKIRFVRIDYDQKKLANIGTFVLFAVLDSEGNAHEKSDEIISELKKLSDKDFKFSDPSIKFNDININYELESLLKAVKKVENFETVIMSRKKVDKHNKDLLRALIDEFREKLSEKILKSLDSGKFGPDVEGLVVKLSNGVSFKVVTKQFSDNKHKFKDHTKTKLKEMFIKGLQQ